MNTGLYVVSIAFWAVSFFKDRKKTKIALKKAWKSFENILPDFLVVILLVGVLLAVISPEMIIKIFGPSSGWFGVVLAALVGAITLIPGFVHFQQLQCFCRVVQATCKLQHLCLHL